MERVILKGRLTEAREKERELDESQAADMHILRNLLDPYQEDATLLNLEQIKIVSNRFYCTVTKLKDTRKLIARLENDLNG